MRLNFNYVKDKDFLLPRRATRHSAGYDIYCPRDEVIFAGEQKLIDLGITWKPEPSKLFEDNEPRLPYDWDFKNRLEFFAKVFDKSGLAHKFRFSTRAGVIDVDYHLKWGLICVNESEKPISFVKGDKISQFVLIPYLFGDDEEKDHWIERTGGYGSTGK